MFGFNSKLALLVWSLDTLLRNESSHIKASNLLSLFYSSHLLCSLVTCWSIKSTMFELLDVTLVKPFIHLSFWKLILRFRACRFFNVWTTEFVCIITSITLKIHLNVNFPLFCCGPSMFTTLKNSLKINNTTPTTLT